MGCLVRRIDDRQLLRIIRRYLEVEIMRRDMVVERSDATPEAGSLSPLLASVALDEVDTELVRRGHRFCMHANDLNVYVGQRRPGAG